MPTFPGFIGPSYFLDVQYDSQRSINLYPIKSESGTSKSISALQGTPGLLKFLELPKFPIRGEIELNGRGFAIAGNGFYELFPDGTYTEWGTLNTTSGAVSMDTNGNQICIVDNPDGYIFDMAANTFTEITDGYYLGAVTVTYINGYFMFDKPDSQVYFWSDLYDGTTGDPLNFASAEGSPDNLVGIKTNHQQVWLFGNSTTQIISDTGGDGTFTTVQGTLIQYGAIAPYSITTSANTIFWLGQDNDGSGVVFMATGYQPQRISTHAVEYAIQQYQNIADAVGYTYQEDGHFFYVLNFPSANTTWVFDVELQLWHERASFVNGQYNRARPDCHMFVFNKHLVGDYQTGAIYVQSLDYYDDDGEPIRRKRVSPHLSDDNLFYTYYNTFQLDMQTGVGLDGFTSGPDYDPQMMLRWSDDGGETWSNEYWVSAGKLGNYNQRVIWRRLGRARSRVFEVVSTAAVKQYWIAAHLEVEKGSN